MSLNLVAALITVLSCLLVVIYAKGPYDAWDALLGILVAIVCIKYKKEFAKDSVSFLLARAGISLSITIIALTVFCGIDETLAINIMQTKFNIFEGDFIVYAVIFAISFAFYRVRS